MNLIKPLIFLLAFSLSTTFYAQETLPEVNISTIAGESVNVSEYGSNGKITIISFWATWCSPCIRELNTIAEIYPDWVEEYDVEFLAITLDTKQRLPRARSIAETNQWEYTILSDSNQDLQRSLGFQNPPQTYVVDKNGVIVYEHNGFNPGDEEDLEEAVAAAAKGEAVESDH